MRIKQTTDRRCVKLLPGFRRPLLQTAPFDQPVQFLAKILHVLKRPVDRSESNVGDRIELPQMLHDNLADLAACHLTPTQTLDIAFDQAQQRTEPVSLAGSLLQGLSQSGFQLSAQVRFLTAIAFYYRKLEQFDSLNGRKTKIAFDALSPTSYGHALRR